MQPMYKEHGPEEFEEQEIHLRDYFRIISKRKYIILTIFAIVFLAAAVMTFTMTPIYTAASQVLIEKNYGSKGLDDQYRFDPDFLDTQAEIIKSANVAGKVVANQRLADRYRHYFLKDEKAGSIAAAVTQFFQSLIQPALAFLRNSPEDTTAASVGLAIPGIAPKSDEQIIAEIISEGLEVTPVKNTKIVSIAYSDMDPAMAKLVAGMTGDMVTLVLSAIDRAKTPVLLAPSMNEVMWSQASTRRNREQLEHDGFTFIGPGSGWQACRAVGPGRMVEPDAIFDEAVRLIGLSGLDNRREV